MAVAILRFHMLALRPNALDVHELRAEVTGFTHGVARSQQHGGHQTHGPPLVFQKEQIDSL